MQIKQPTLFTRCLSWGLLALMAWLLVFAFTQSHSNTFSWQFLNFNGINLSLMVQFDTLAKMMMSFIFLIGLLIFRYARTYLESDPTRSRFLFQFTLVLASVLLLIMAANLLTAFVAWQFIGLNLYLLLNHYHHHSAANRAAKKKFVINRLGDVCFLLATVLAYHSHSAASFVSLQTSPDAGLICGLLVVSVMTKCAQFPFHVWLIDTMETPTPVSALMHAGVINAGGVLLTRVSASFVEFQGLSYLILAIGLLSAALSILWMNQQADIKKKLAYSTMGQMGYMLVQCGLGAFPAAIFHLMSHGFYKASLFLNSGETLTQKKPKSTTVSLWQLVRAFFISSLLLLLAVLIFREDAGYVPVLMYGFIFCTLLSLSLQLNKPIHYLVLAILLCTYLFFLHLFSHLLPGYDFPEAIPNGVQIILVACMIVLQTSFWLMKASNRRRRFKDKTESYLRRFALNPLRQLGNVINIPRYKKTAVMLYLLLLLFILVTFFLGLDHNALTMHLHAKINNALIFSFLSIAIVALIAANRCLSLKSLWLYLLLFELSFINLAWFDGNYAITKIGLFHLINISAVLIMLTLLTRRGTTATQARFNRFPIRVFYLTISLLLLIGIPGTASFVSEFYLLIALASDKVCFIVMYLALIILLAIVVMHSLQLYVFGKDQKSLLLSPLNKFEHLIFIVIISLNIVCGIFPQLLLGHL